MLRETRHTHSQPLRFPDRSRWVEGRSGLISRRPSIFLKRGALASCACAVEARRFARRGASVGTVAECLSEQVAADTRRPPPRSAHAPPQTSSGAGRAQRRSGTDAARSRRRLTAEAHPDHCARMVARAASDVSRAMPEIDDLASNESNRLAFEAVAHAAARCLVAAADIRDRQWLLAEANEAVREVAVRGGWTSQLALGARRSPPAS